MSIAPTAIVLDCLGCQRGLKLPGAAAGRIVKCPACGAMSPVPHPLAPQEDDPEDVLGDLLSEMFHEDEDDEDEDDFAPEPARQPKPQPQRDAAAQQALPANARAATHVKAAPRPPVAAAPQPVAHRPPVKRQPAATPPVTAPTAGATRRSEPAFLQTGPPRRLTHPFLAISRCSIAGVELRFPESQLTDPLFRASMPERCVITGERRGKSDLTARPMVYINKDESGDRQARAVETQFEIAVDASYDHNDYIGKIGTIGGLTTPFDLPMPYLVSADLFDTSLRCLSVRSDSHAAYCRVIIPAVATAAEWIANVNGTTNAAWRYLQQHANQFSCEAWVRMPHRIRDRIKAWCNFFPGESFVAYARHADTVAKESGLGGLLVTDQRLIYHMFRKRAEFPLDRPLKIRVRRDASGVHFAAASGDAPLKKLGLINPHEAPLVFEALESASAALTVESDLNEGADAPDEEPDLSTLFAA